MYETTPRWRFPSVCSSPTGFRSLSAQRVETRTERLCLVLITTSGGTHKHTLISSQLLCFYRWLESVLLLLFYGNLYIKRHKRGRFSLSSPFLTDHIKSYPKNFPAKYLHWKTLCRYLLWNKLHREIARNSTNDDKEMATHLIKKC